MSTSTASRSERGSLLQHDAVRVMTAVRSPVDRVRSRVTAAAAAGIGVALLIAGSMATIRDDVLIGTSVSTGADGVEVSEDMFEAGGGLAPFLAQPGLRPGVVVAAVLLVLPFLALAVQALRVGQVVEERRSRQLLFAGATWADLRRLRAVRTSAAFVRGGLLAGPAYLLLWLVLGLALPAGSRLLPPLHWAMPLIWLAAIGVLWIAARALAVLAFPREDALAWQSAGLHARVPSRLFVIFTALGGAALVFATPVVGANDALFAVQLVVAVVLFLLAAGAGAARSAAGAIREPGVDEAIPGSTGRLARRRGNAWWRFGARDTAVSLLADAQRRGSTTAVTSTAGVLFICGLSFGVEAAMTAEVLSQRGSDTGYGNSDIAFHVGGAGLSAAVGLVAALVAIAALLLSLTDHLLGNRRAVASTAALGIELRRLVRVQALCLVRTAVPVTVIGVLVAALPYSLMLLGHVEDGRSASAFLPLGVAVVVAVIITVACHLLARALAGRVREASALQNLRVP